MTSHQYQWKPHESNAGGVYQLGHESPRPVTTQYKRYSLLTPTEWLLEIVTALTSLLFLAAITVIFWLWDERPISDWTFPLSFNAVISILTTACSAALMHSVSESISQLKWLHFKNGPRKLENFEKFDKASRGLSGSVKFLFTVKWNLATMGALVTILRFAFGPLAQQVVLVEERQLTTTDPGATYGYSHEYDRGDGTVTVVSTVDTVLPDVNLQAAILEGLYNMNTTAKFSCPGACTWTETTFSLGFKAQCRDVTEQALRSADCDVPRLSDQSWTCNITTPAGLELQEKVSYTSSGTNFAMSSSGSGRILFNDPHEKLPVVASFAVYRATSNGNFAPQNVNITDCSLSVTAYEYFQPQATGTTFSFGSIREVDFGVENPWKQQDLDGVNPYAFTEKIQDRGIPGFKISLNDLLALDAFIQSSAFVSEFIAGSSRNANLGFSLALMGDVDLGQRFDNMAKSMTDYVRSGPNGQLAVGQRVETVAFFTVRWYFLIGPIAIEAGAVIFAALAIFSNRESRGVPLWKSSALATLICRWESQYGVIFPSYRDIKEVQQTAGKSLAKLD